MPQSIPALVLIGVWSFCFEVNVGCISWSYKHPPRIARVCSLPLYIPYFGVEYIFVFRPKEYQRYIVKSIVTDATLTLWGFGRSRRCARFPLKGAFIRLLTNQSIDVFQIFHHASVEMYEIFITYWCLDIPLNVLLQFRGRRNQQCSWYAFWPTFFMLLLTLLPAHSISSELWSAFCSMHEIAFY